MQLSNASDTEPSLPQNQLEACLANFELKLFLFLIRNWHKAITEAWKGTMQSGDDRV
jgi:hypothetical protein